jgi:hypothetical protein
MVFEHPHFVDYFPIKPSMYGGFPIAMFDYRRVTYDSWDASSRLHKGHTDQEDSRTLARLYRG